MKKILCTVALMLLIAGTAYADATFSMTGKYWAEGKYWFNYNPDTITAAQDAAGTRYHSGAFGFYEQDINLYPKITVDNTSLNFKIAITDVNWGAYASEGSEKITKTDTMPSDDDNIQIERAYMTHKFNDKLSLDVGLMNGTQWGTTFGDDNQPQWRVKVTGKTDIGILIGVLEKNNEWGVYSTEEDGTYGLSKEGIEDKDHDSYGLGYITKAGDIYIKQLLWYKVINNSLISSSFLDYDGLTPTEIATKKALALSSNSKMSLFNPVLALNADLDGFGFESEINYKMWDINIGDIGVKNQRFETLGLYLNLWFPLDAMTPGFFVAYGSYDKGIYDEADGLTQAAAAYAGIGQTTLATYAATSAALIRGVADKYAAFDFDDDFDSTTILGDEFCWGGGGNSDDLAGMSIAKFYINDIKAADKLALNCYAAYVKSNQRDKGATINDYAGASALEAGLGGDYSFTDNFTYSVYGALAKLRYKVKNAGYFDSLGDDYYDVENPGSVYYIANAVTFKF